MFDAAAETVSSLLPFPLPVPSQFVEDEDFENLDNLRRLSSLLSASSEVKSSAEVNLRKAMCDLKFGASLVPF